MNRRLGALALTAVFPLFLIANVVTGLRWRDPPFSWAMNNVSDLGNATCGIVDPGRPRLVCSPWHDLMNAALVATAVLLAAGLVLASRHLPGRVLLCCAPAGYALAGLFPADTHENPHVLGAVLVLWLGNLGLVVTAIRGRRLRGFTAAAAGVAVAGTVLFFARQGLGVGVGAMERVALFPLLLWATVTGVVLLRDYQSSARRARQGRPSGS